jgi:hypothetical protein
MNKLLKLPRWSILSLIVMTMLLSVVILARIWFPEWVPRDIFSKVFWTYIVLICSSAVIAKMTTYLKDMGDDQLS